MLGRTLEGLGERARAAVEFDKVRASTRDPALLRKSLAALPDREEASLRHERALDAAAEARFFFADQKRAAADRIRAPAYRGIGKREDVVAFLDTEFLRFSERKLAAIQAAEKEFATVVAIEPRRPRWAIATAARVGQLRSGFADDLRAAPIVPPPPGVDFRTVYDGIEVTDIPREAAKKAFVACLDMSIRYRTFDENSRACEAWLARHHGAEFHAQPELVLGPSWLGPALVAQPALR